MVAGIGTKNGIWFPSCGGQPEPGVDEFSSAAHRDSVESKNQATIQAFFQKVWNGRDTASVEQAIDSLVGQNYQRHYEGKLLQGREQLKICVKNMQSEVTEFYIALLSMVASYNLVGVTIHIRWTLDGVVYEMSGIEMYRLHNDLIAESWHATEHAPGEFRTGSSRRAASR
jgi:predicted SnoaL-like aldol condensation-catalyzing enzyme